MVSSSSRGRFIQYALLPVLLLLLMLGNTSSSIFQETQSVPHMPYMTHIPHTLTQATGGSSTQQKAITIPAHCDSHQCTTVVPAKPGPGSIINTSPDTKPYTAHFIDTWNNIHTFLTFDNNISDPGNVAPRYDFVWGAQTDHAPALLSSNPNISLSFYIPFHRDNDANHDLTYWKSTHPDWILYKCDRVTPAYEYGSPNMPLDFANPALVSWQVQSYGLPASTEGYNSIAADNVDPQNLWGACGVYIKGQWVQRYSGQANDPQWDVDIINWLTRMQQALHSLPHPLALIPNLGSSAQLFTSAQLQQVVSHIDGIMDESGFTDYGNGYVTGNAWLNLVQFIENMQQQGKPYYIINLFSAVSSVGVQWALASYLMCKQHSSALFIGTAAQYGFEAWHNEYNARVGYPVDSMYKAQNVYWRDYSQGLSIVNPSSTATYSITLNSTHHYIDLYGNSVGSTLSLSPHSGIVLLTAT